MDKIRAGYSFWLSQCATNSDLDLNREFCELPGGPSTKPKCKGILTPGTRVIYPKNAQRMRKKKAKNEQKQRNVARQQPKQLIENQIVTHLKNEAAQEKK